MVGILRGALRITRLLVRGRKRERERERDRCSHGFHLTPAPKIRPKGGAKRRRPARPPDRPSDRPTVRAALSKSAQKHEVTKYGPAETLVCSARSGSVRVDGNLAQPKVIRIQFWDPGPNN